MKVIVTNRFLNDIARIKLKEVVDQALFYIDYCEKVHLPDEIPGFKYLRQYTGKGRIELAPFRIGVEILGNSIIFIRILSRDKIYNQFP